MLEKNIKFIPTTDYMQNRVEFPRPASQFIPDWYKNINSYIDINYGSKAPTDNGHISNSTVKKCMPFFDAMTSGYIYTLPADIMFVDSNNYSYRVIWDVSYDIVGIHNRVQVGDMPVPYGYSELFKWYFPFIIKTPPGYSCMIMHPNFLYNTPFLTISGIVDTDTHPVAINFPFFLKNGYNGKIDAGTPICQIIPFKRDIWKMTKEKSCSDYNSVLDKFHSIMENSYKKRFWSRKLYK